MPEADWTAGDQFSPSLLDLHESAMQKVRYTNYLNIIFCVNCNVSKTAIFFLQEIAVKPIVNRLLPPKKEGIVEDQPICASCT